MTSVRLETKIAVPEDVVFRELDDEAVLLQMETGRYFGLDPVATRMWTALDEHETLGGALESLCTEYEATRERIRQDLEELVSALAERRLLRIEGT